MSELNTIGDWLSRRSYRAAQWGPEELFARKHGQRISVVIPARDEESSIGPIVETVRRCLMERVPLVDELIVVDSQSRDHTAEVAEAAGARVVGQDDVLPRLTPMSGKGEALWKGLAASTGELVAFVDGDLRDFSPHFVTGLLGPLLTDENLCYVKGFYHRSLVHGAALEEDGGGRVTELLARPLLNLFWPELAGFVQPLAGEYAARRSTLVQLPFVAHYGVEVGHLVDLLESHGLDAMGQVDLGERRHRHQSTQRLGLMSGQILLTVLSRLQRGDRLPEQACLPATMTLTQFEAGESTWGVDRKLVRTELEVPERPSLASVMVSS